MKKFRITLAASVLIALVGCKQATTPSGEETSIPTISPSVFTSPPPAVNSSPGSSSTAASSSSTNTPEVNPSPIRSPVAAPNAGKPDKNQLISANGIGTAKVGMTIGKLKQSLAGKAEFRVMSPFIVDFDAIAVTQSGKAQYYILYPAGSPPRDSDAIEALVTDNPDYRTAEGVGPGTPIQKAEAIYGDATLSYSTVNESREYVKFAKSPSENVSFRLGAANDGSLAGLYSSASGELNQTKDYKKTAAISLVEVYCSQNCPAPPPPSAPF